MTVLTEEIREIEEAAEHAREVAEDARNDGNDECASEHGKLFRWLSELLQLKRAYLAAETFNSEEWTVSPDISEDEETEEDEENNAVCPRCGNSGFVERQDGVYCSNCGGKRNDT